MATTTFDTLTSFAILAGILSATIFACYSVFSLARRLAHVVWCWWYGVVPVGARQEARAALLGQLVDYGDEESLEAMCDVVSKDGEAIARKVRRRKHAPFAAYVVNQIRGAHLSQCIRTPANVLVFERHARSIVAKHGVRPSDAARVLPYATMLFFDHRSYDQIEAAAMTHAASNVRSRQAYSALYVGTAGSHSFGGGD